MRKQFKQTILELAQKDPRIVMVLGDVSVYLFQEFKERYPERFYNLGICENTMVSVAAGLASQGFIPFAHTIAPFITERSFEQFKLDLGYNRFAANIVSCGASFDYAWDGSSHHTYWDLAILRMIPGLRIFQPGSCRELDVLLRSQLGSGQPAYYRLSDHPHSVDLTAEFGKAAILKDCGASVTVVTAGPILGNVVEACRDIHVNLVYFHTLKPFDEQAIRHFARSRFLVVHDAHGLFEAVCGLGDLRVSYHGLPDEFVACYGTVHDVRKKIALDVEGIRAAIKRFEVKDVL